MQLGVRHFPRLRLGLYHRQEKVQMAHGTPCRFPYALTIRQLNAPPCADFLLCESLLPVVRSDWDVSSLFTLFCKTKSASQADYCIPQSDCFERDNVRTASLLMRLFPCWTLKSLLLVRSTVRLCTHITRYVTIRPFQSTFRISIIPHAHYPASLPLHSSTCHQLTEPNTTYTRSLEMPL